MQFQSTGPPSLGVGLVHLLFTVPQTFPLWPHISTTGVEPGFSNRGGAKDYVQYISDEREVPCGQGPAEPA